MNAFRRKEYSEVDALFSAAVGGREKLNSRFSFDRPRCQDIYTRIMSEIEKPQFYSNCQNVSTFKNIYSNILHTRYLIAYSHINIIYSFKHRRMQFFLFLFFYLFKLTPYQAATMHL